MTVIGGRSLGFSHQKFSPTRFSKPRNFLHTEDGPNALGTISSPRHCSYLVNPSKMFAPALRVLCGNELDANDDVEPPSKFRNEFYDLDLLPFQTLRAKIMRINNKGKWIETGHGTVFMYYDSARGLGRIKALDERKVFKMHAYLGAGHPIGRHEHNKNAFVMKLWSSTLTFKRALFCLAFDTEFEAYLFRVLFEIATNLAHDHTLRVISYLPDKDELEKNDELLKGVTEEETDDEDEEDEGKKAFDDKVVKEDGKDNDDNDNDDDNDENGDNDNEKIPSYMVDESQNPFGDLNLNL